MADEQDREPTAEESAGMRWWNALTEGERANCAGASRRHLGVRAPPGEPIEFYRPAALVRLTRNRSRRRW